MALSNLLVPNSYKLYEATTYIPTFSADANNAYTNLGSSYVLSNDGNQVNVSCKFRVVGANAGLVATNMSLPLAASGTLAALAPFGPSPLVVSSTGATTLNITNNVAGNLANAAIPTLALTSSGNPASTYTCELKFKYMLVAANN